MSELKDVISRLIHGEPKATKRFTVFYWDSSLPSKMLKALFGLRGCYRRDCDDFHFRYQPSGFGFAAMIDKENNSGKYIWSVQVENYIINFDYTKIIEEVEQDVLNAMKTSLKNEVMAQYEARGAPPVDSYHG